MWSYIVLFCSKDDYFDNQSLMLHSIGSTQYCVFPVFIGFSQQKVKHKSSLHRSILISLFQFPFPAIVIYRKLEAFVKIFKCHSVVLESHPINS